MKSRRVQATSPRSCSCETGVQMQMQCNAMKARLRRFRRRLCVDSESAASVDAVTAASVVIRNPCTGTGTTDTGIVGYRVLSSTAVMLAGCRPPCTEARFPESMVYCTFNGRECGYGTRRGRGRGYE